MRAPTISLDIAAAAARLVVDEGLDYANAEHFTEELLAFVDSLARFATFGAVGMIVGGLSQTGLAQVEAEAVAAGIARTDRTIVADRTIVTIETRAKEDTHM